MLTTLLPFFTALILGVHAFSLKLLADAAHPVYGTFFYMGLASILLIGMCFYVWRQGVPLPAFSISLAVIIIFAAVTAAIYAGAFFFTISQMPSFSTVFLIVQAGSVLVGTLLSILFLQDVFSWTKAGGFALALLGMVLVIKG